MTQYPLLIIINIFILLSITITILIIIPMLMVLQYAARADDDRAVSCLCIVISSYSTPLYYRLYIDVVKGYNEDRAMHYNTFPYKLTIALSFVSSYCSFLPPDMYTHISSCNIPKQNNTL